MKNEKLAIFGGNPVLKKPFPPQNSIGREETRAALAVMKKRVLSDFLGQAGDKFLGGKYVKKFESKIGRYFKVKHAVSFNSATTALQAAVAALGIGPGDEVITSPFTMSATVTSILFNGALPVFADIDPDSFCLDSSSVKKMISPRTKAILVVNLFGGSADYKKILQIAKENDLKIIEDNAQSIGAKYGEKYLGTIGNIGVFSFNVHKTLQCGEGGVLVTNDEKLVFRAQLVRNHGEAAMEGLVKQGIYEPIIGSNYRLTELHAAVASEQLKKLNLLNQSRIELADYLTVCLKKFSWLEAVRVAPGTTHVYYVYPFKFIGEKIAISREIFAYAMKAEGFPLGVGYVRPLYLLPVFQKREMFPNSSFPFENSSVSYKKGICPVAERLYEKELLLTGICYWPRTRKDIDLFILAIKKIEQNVGKLRAYEKKCKK